MRSETDAALINRYRSELIDARDALLNAYRQLAALRTERKMQEARQKQIRRLTAERDEARSRTDLHRSRLNDADERIADASGALSDAGIPEVVPVIEEAPSAGGVTMSVADRIRRLTAQREEARWEVESIRSELAKRADAQNVEAKRILDMDQVIENWRNAYNTDIAMAAGQVRRLTTERNEARAQAESADIELNQVRQEVTTLKTELSEARRSLKAVTRDLDALLRAAQSKSVRTVEETMAGQAGVLATLAPHDRSAPPTTDPLASVHARIDAVAADVQSLWNMLGRHADAIAELRGKEGDNG